MQNWNIKTFDLNINPTRRTTLTKQESHITTHYTITATGKITKIDQIYYPEKKIVRTVE